MAEGGEQSIEARAIKGCAFSAHGCWVDREDAVEFGPAVPVGRIPGTGADKEMVVIDDGWGLASASPH
jgi:hypothetical protein